MAHQLRILYSLHPLEMMWSFMILTEKQSDQDASSSTALGPNTTLLESQRLSKMLTFCLFAEKSAQTLTTDHRYAVSIRHIM